MIYFKAILSVLAAIFLACVVVFWPVFREIGGRNVAIGIEVFIISLRSPVFWVIAAVFFALLFVASRINNVYGKILLFWMPAVFFSTLTVTISALFTYLFFYNRHLAGP